jgi:hypothetical protein
MSDDTYTQKIQILGKTYLLKEDSDSCTNCVFLKETADFCINSVRPHTMHLSHNPERGGCATGEHILIEDTPEAILRYIERKLNIDREEDDE